MTSTQSQLQFSYDYLLRLAGVTPEELYFGAASVAEEAAAARDILELAPVGDDEDIASGLAEWARMNLDEQTGQVIA
jgi:hypothetical protein